MHRLRAAGDDASLLTWERAYPAALHPARGRSESLEPDVPPVPDAVRTLRWDRPWRCAAAGRDAAQDADVVVLVHVMAAQAPAHHRRRADRPGRRRRTGEPHHDGTPAAGHHHSGPHAGDQPHHARLHHVGHHVVEAALGPGQASPAPDCGAGTTLVQHEGLVLLLRDGAFRGWTTIGDDLRTQDGLGTGTTLDALRAARPDVQVSATTLGVEWAEAGEGGLAGTLEGDAGSDPVTSLRAGEACLFR